MFRKGSTKFLRTAVKGVRAQQLPRKEGCCALRFEHKAKRVAVSVAACVQAGAASHDARDVSALTQALTFANFVVLFN
jgi:hypothetical protein